ncbi:hypothetical protein [Caldalkalibacillus mannanilyticus]|uniref:hypothetical protein n=1 Tax=Caldalkalibacillus mannanilyticus TaxID=1418 RepID=UPI0004690374|nr:hypothetical protein [Caldalkalibacillus mannanilyticus]
MIHRYYQTCCQHVGKQVAIRTMDGRFYRGTISRVTKEHVYLEAAGRGVEGEKLNRKGAVQADNSMKKEKGSEIFFFAPFIVPLAAIAGLTLIGVASLYPRPYYGGYGGGFWW